MQLFIDVEVGFSGTEIQYVNNFLGWKKKPAIILHAQRLTSAEKSNT